MPSKRSKPRKSKLTEPILIAIDPGKNGCAAILDGIGTQPILYRFGKEDLTPFMWYVEDVRKENTLVAMEHIWARQGVHSSGVMMEAYGILQGILLAYGIPYHSITPKNWHKLAGIKFPNLSDLPERKRYTARKRHMVELATESWPNLKGITQDTADSLMMLRALQKWPLSNLTSS